MPTERFYRLPEAKKHTIREAAMKEFARVPFEKASINQIIHNADISRGSFYTYFEDKQDVVRYLFEESSNKMKQLCQRELETNHGDYFAMMEQLFEYSVKSMQDSEDMLHVAKNVFSYEENARIIGMTGFPSPAEVEKTDGPIRWLFSMVDKQRLRWKDFEHFVSLFGMSMAVVALSSKQYYQYPDQLQVIRKNFLTSMQVLRYGAYREPQNI